MAAYVWAAASLDSEMLRNPLVVGVIPAWEGGEKSQTLARAAQRP